MPPTPFSIAVPDRDIADLQARLRRTRWPPLSFGPGWRYGADLNYMQAFCRYWADDFDWRVQERRLNALPQFTAVVDGCLVHFVHVKGKGPRPLPLVMTHGWPSSVAEFYKIIPLLADPQAHGGDAADAFDVVVPSLPGFGFSQPLAGVGAQMDSIAELWRKLMTDELGYERFVAHGGDVGGAVTNRLALHDAVSAIHVISAPQARVRSEPPLTQAEQDYLARLRAWMQEEGAYAHQQGTRPQTMAIALDDSPAGLAALIVEKWRAWSDCDGDVESRFSKDELLTNICLYWFTGAISSAARVYLRDRSARPPERIKKPARLFLSGELVNRCPREWAERTYESLSYGMAETGGHFLAAEESELLAEDLRRFFRSFR